MFFCPSDPYRGLTTGWSPSGENAEPKNRARIIHYRVAMGVAYVGTLPPSVSKGSSCEWHC